MSTTSNRTVDCVGSKTVSVRTTGHEKTHFTTVLACMADGTKLPPMVIFKRKTMPKEKFPVGVIVHVHQKGWMDTDGMMIWLQKAWGTTVGTEDDILWQDDRDAPCADSDNEGEEMYDDMLTTDQMIQMLEEEDSDEEFLGF